MWKCLDCGAIFYEPCEKSWREDMNGDGWAFQTITDLFCPYCGSDEIEQYYGKSEETI